MEGSLRRSRTDLSMDNYFSAVAETSATRRRTQEDQEYKIRRQTEEIAALREKLRESQLSVHALSKQAKSSAQKELYNRKDIDKLRGENVALQTEMDKLKLRTTLITEDDQAKRKDLVREHDRLRHLQEETKVCGY